MDNQGTSITNKDAVKELSCSICGNKMDVERGLYGPTSYASAMAHIERWYDKFTCPNLEKDWHQQALEILKLIEDTPSKTIADLLNPELRKILRSRAITKESWKKF